MQDIRVTSDGWEAVQEAQRLQPNLILLDVPDVRMSECLHLLSRNGVRVLSRHPLKLQDDASGYPSLLILGLVAKLRHEPVCLHQPKPDPFPEPEV